MPRYLLWIALAVVTPFMFFLKGNLENSIRTPDPNPQVYLASHGAEAPKMKVRMLILKHSKEHMADGDANLAITAVQKASAKGLSIRVVGNHFVDNKMLAYYVVSNFENLRATVHRHIKDSAEAGDTLIVFTIGHGFPNGGLHNIGQRADVMKMLVEAAEQHNQKILWWQLSCHAAAHLPAISSLTARQQELFSILATSTASQTSAAYVQGKIMEKVFVAMADETRAIDPNGDGIITASELRSFLNGDGSKRGDLLYSRNPDYPIFGGSTRIILPIRDRNNPQGRYDDEYILLPTTR